MGSKRGSSTPWALRDSSTEGVRNLFSGDRPTFVEADLVISGSRLKVRHIGVGEGGRLEMAAPSWDPLDQGQCSARSVPSDRAGSEHAGSSISLESSSLVPVPFDSCKHLKSSSFFAIDTPEAQGVRARSKLSRPLRDCGIAKPRTDVAKGVGCNDAPAAYRRRNNRSGRNRIQQRSE